MEKFIEKFIELDTIFDLAVKHNDKLVASEQAKQFDDLLTQMYNELTLDEALEVFEVIANI